MNLFPFPAFEPWNWAGVVPERLVCGEIRREPVSGVSDQAAVILLQKEGMWEE